MKIIIMIRHAQSIHHTNGAVDARTDGVWRIQKTVGGVSNIDHNGERFIKKLSDMSIYRKRFNLDVSKNNFMRNSFAVRVPSIG